MVQVNVVAGCEGAAERNVVSAGVEAFGIAFVKGACDCFVWMGGVLADFAATGCVAVGACPAGAGFVFGVV